MSSERAVSGNGYHIPSVHTENSDDLRISWDDDHSDLFISEPELDVPDINMVDFRQDQTELVGDSIIELDDNNMSSNDDDGGDEVEKDEIVILDEGPKIKEESQEVDCSWVDIGDDVIELSDSDEDNPNTRRLATLGNSILQRSNVGHRRTSDNPDRLREMQRLFANRALEGKRYTGGAGRIFTTPQAQVNKTSTNNSDNWMYSVPKEEDDSSSNFAQIKRLYKAKRKAKKNSLEDDINFKKAQVAEKGRLKRLEVKFRQSQLHIYSDEEAEESDDGIFMPPTKRPNPTIIEISDQEPVAPETIEPKRRKVQKNSTKRTRAELQKEELANLMAGWEERAFLVPIEDTHGGPQNDNGTGKVGKNAGQNTNKKAAKKTTKKATKKISKKARSGGQKDKDSSAKYTDDLLSGHPPGRKRRNKPSKVMASLRTGDIYKAANSNLKKAAVPVLTGTRKDHAMASLIAAVPLDETKKRQAISDKNLILKATTVLGNCTVYNKDDSSSSVTLQKGAAWALKGMTSALFHHQVLGAGKMKQRETGANEPFGGILADSMGFGKTVMIIALIVANPPGPEETHRSTLIICSPALIEQWDQEIDKHANKSIFGEIIKHYGLNKLSTKGASGRRSILNIEKADIVLSTYYEIIKSYPKCHIPADLKNTEEDEQFRWWQKEWDERREMLHRAHFYRVVLDEAHVIKNHSSSTSIACRALMAKHKWAVSGTPIHNSIEELYPYFKFLRIPYTNTFEVFRQNFCQQGSKTYNQRLHSILDDTLIRRTHGDELLGTAIFQLPENHQETIMLDFNKIERAIYDTIRERFLKAIAKAIERNDLEQRARLVLIMFQRLRQLTSHILMLQEPIEKLFEVEDVEKIWNRTKSEVMTDSGNVNDMKTALQGMLTHKNDVECEAPLDTATSLESEVSPDTSVLDTSASKKPNHEDTIIFKFRKYLRMLRHSKEWDNLRARSTCNKCGDPADDPWVTSCMHLYCGECLRALSNESVSNDKDGATCLQCGVVFNGSERCPALRELEMDDSEQPTAETAAEKDERPHRTHKDNMKWCELGNERVLPSTKTAAVQVQVEKWLQDFPESKIIVFSQFHLSMQVIGKLFEAKGWTYCTYHGKMTHKARAEAVETFGKDPKVKIMIASLKCGGIGLNLTMATRVICIDLWFNSCIEQQAFCRVFRIGQTQETYLTRFVIKNTVDEKLIKMQKRKDIIVGAAMDDRTVLSSLSMEELMELFGDGSPDDNAKPFIYAEEYPELAHLVPDLGDGEEDTVAWQA